LLQISQQISEAQELFFLEIPHLSYYRYIYLPLPFIYPGKIELFNEEKPLS